MCAVFRLCHRGLAAVLTLVLLFLSVPHFGQIVEADTLTIPLEVVLPGGNFLSVVQSGETLAWYLPSAVDRSAVTVRYTGAGHVECSGSDLLLKSGDTAVLDCSAPAVSFTEQIGEVQATYTVQIYAAAPSVASLHFTLQTPETNRFPTTVQWLNNSKNNKTSGQLRMLDGEGREIYSGGLDTIKCRGNTSFERPGFAADKKSFNIKLSKKAELVSGAGKMKKWALIHMRVSDRFTYDWTGLSNLLGFQTYGALMGPGYADIKARYVDVYIDGDYRGVYILSERNDINSAISLTDTEEYVTSKSDARRKVIRYNDPVIQMGVQTYQYTADAKKVQDFDMRGGYLLEVNIPELEECGFITRKGLIVDIKVPEVCTQEQVQYIAGYFQLFEDALYSPTGYNSIGKHYSEYVDMESLAGMVITYAFFLNWELFRTSTYMYIDVADSDHPRLTFGPAWDFEGGADALLADRTLLGENHTYSEAMTNDFLTQLWQKGDFLQLLYEKQQELVKITEAILEQGEQVTGIQSANATWTTALDSLNMNWIRWDYQKTLAAHSKYKNNGDNTYTFYAAQYVEALKKRKSVWDALWDGDTYLFGVAVSGDYDSKSGLATLTAKTAGTVGQYAWYRLAENNTLQVLEGATDAVYTAAEPGTYYCVASGENNAYYRWARGRIFSNKTIQMTSKPIVVTASGISTGLHSDTDPVLGSPIATVGSQTTTTATTTTTSTTVGDDVAGNRPGTTGLPAFVWVLVVLAAMVILFLPPTILILRRRMDRTTAIQEPNQTELKETPLAADVSADAEQ